MGDKIELDAAGIEREISAAIFDPGAEVGMIAYRDWRSGTCVRLSPPSTGIGMSMTTVFSG